ncbi:MAG: sulfotransferase [Actinomycetota bacterium]|nr:sulfotransferase [Actinomycetota bacterium]
MSTPERSPAVVPVLYVGGYTRSGTTLVGLMLDKLPGVASAGELRYLWRQGPLNNRLCSCGAPFRECPFWSEVGRRAYGGWDRVPLDELVDFEQRYLRVRFIPWFTLSRRPRGFARVHASYADHLARLYRAIRDVSGCSVVVDSSKDPTYGFALRTVPGIELRLVHLVRDSRGVAYSWTKTVERPEVVGERAFFDRFSPLETGYRWSLWNAAFDVLKAFGVPSERVRYESVPQSPDAVVRGIAALASANGAADDVPELFGGGEFVPASGHMIGGNPIRFSRGAMRIRLDDEWRNRMAARERWAVTAVSWPLLLRHGYLSKQAAGEGER